MIVFVDRVGGALASLAASIAASRGLAARAVTREPLRQRTEVREALAEIGIASVVDAQQLAEPIVGDDEVELGRAPLDVSLYDGPPTTAFGDTGLERIALARISRDKIERWLETRDLKA
ncbi:MAG: hypothetical protein IPG04_00485 [Polyangiaceae bacterium]|jgi:hypothetical protein|nr:hypothetical protein [Polyangiaceae bacterium]